MSSIMEGKLMKRREFLPKWDRRYFQIVIDLKQEVKYDQVQMKVFTVSGGKAITTKTLLGAKIRLADSNQRSDSGRFDIQFLDGEKFRLNAKDRFDRQAWIDEIVSILQEYSEDPLESEDIIEHSQVSISSQSSHLTPLTSPRSQATDSTTVDAVARPRPARKVLEKICSGVEIGEVQDAIRRRTNTGRSKSMGKDKMIRREKSRNRVARTLTSLSGSTVRRNSRRGLSETEGSKAQGELPGSPLSLRRGPSFISLQNINGGGASTIPPSPSPNTSPRFPPLSHVRTRVNVKKAKSDVAALVRKSMSGRLERIHDNATPTPPKHRKILSGEVSFASPEELQARRGMRTNSWKQNIVHQDVKEQEQRSPRYVYENGKVGNKQGVSRNLAVQQAKGKKWKLIKNVMHLMPNKTHAEKIDEFLGELLPDARMSYETPAINSEVNELDLFTCLEDPSSTMVASIHEHYVRCVEFVENNESLFCGDLVLKLRRWDSVISGLSPAAGFAAKAFYVVEVTRANPSWCCSSVQIPGMRIGYSSPQESIVELLRKPDICNLVYLKECLSYASTEWVAMFFRLRGVDALFQVQQFHLQVVSSGAADAFDAVLQVLLCLQALLSNDKGMELAIQHPTFVSNLLTVMEYQQSDKVAHNFLAILILTSIMLYDGQGYQKVMQAVLHVDSTQNTSSHHLFQLDDIAEHEESIPQTKNNGYVRNLVNMLNTDNGDIDLDLCDNVIKFMSAVLVTAETVEERRYRKQFVHALQECEIYSVLELLTCDMTFVGNDAILGEIDNLKCLIASCLNDVIARNHDDAYEEICASSEAHAMLPRSQSAAVRSLCAPEYGPPILRKSVSIPAPPPPPPTKIPPLLQTKQGVGHGKHVGPKPQLKMKSLFWDKISSTRVKGSFWEKIGTSINNIQCVDFKELEKLFQATVKRNSTPNKTNKKGKLQVLDIKRATTIGIILSKFPVPWEKIRDTIITMDTTIFRCSEDVGAVIEMVPKEDERNKMQSYIKSGGSMEGLSEAELACMDVMQIPRAESRLRTFQQKFLIQDKLNEVRKVLETHSVAMRQLQTSRVFRLLLQMVLLVGNFMNFNTRLGSAYGFKLKNLNKLQDTRSIDSKLSLLCYIANQICKSGYPILSDEIPALIKSELKTSLTEVYETICKVTNIVVEMEEELQHQPTKVFMAISVAYDQECMTQDSSEMSKQSTYSYDSDCDDSTQEQEYVKVNIIVDNYEDIMTSEITIIKKRLNILMDKLQVCKAQFEKLLLFFGDTLQSSSNQEFWQSVVSFVDRFSTQQRSAYRDLREEIEKRKRTLKRQINSQKHIGVGDLEKNMAALLAASGETDLDAQVEAILIGEFGVERLSLGANGPEASKRSMLMKILATLQQQEEHVSGQRRAHVRQELAREKVTISPHCMYALLYLLQLIQNRIPLLESSLDDSDFYDCETIENGKEEEQAEGEQQFDTNLLLSKMNELESFKMRVLELEEQRDELLELFTPRDTTQQDGDIIKDRLASLINQIREETEYQLESLQNQVLVLMETSNEVEFYKKRIQNLESHRDVLSHRLLMEGDGRNRSFRKTSFIDKSEQQQLESLQDQVYILMEKAAMTEQQEKRIQDLERHRDMLSQRLLLEGDGRSRSFRIAESSVGRHRSFYILGKIQNEQIRPLLPSRSVLN